MMQAALHIGVRALRMTPAPAVHLAPPRCSRQRRRHEVAVSFPPWMTAAAVTAGFVLTAFTTSREKTTLCCQSNLLFGSEMVIVRMLRGLKPGSTANT